MARGPRDDAPGTAHHVMVRGIERRPIFLDDRDREDFVRRLSQLIPGLGHRCFAWALMPNHAHLVVRSGHARISQLMARLGTGYARRFNERHERVGHLFQNRFRSRRVIDDDDLMGLVLYVTRNPLEGGLVPDAAALERFPWCGLGALMGRRMQRPFEAVGETMALFDPDPARARSRLAARLSAPGPAPSPLPSRFHGRDVPLHPVVAGFERLVGDVCVRAGITADELCSRSRHPQLAATRAVVAARAARELGLPGAEIARRLRLSKQAVSVLLARGTRGASEFGPLDERPR